MTSERISDERLAELRAIQDKRIKGRGGVPEVRDLAKALTELIESRQRVSEALAIERWPYRPSTMAGYDLDRAEGYNDARREFRSALGVTADD